MSEEPQQMRIEDAPPSERDDQSEASEDESEPEAPADLMVTTRARRSNAGNRMSTLLAKSAEEEEWGEEWEDAPNEEEFRGDDVNEQEDYNMDSSSSEEDDDGGDEDEAGEKELRKTERQEKNKKRKAATNPFAARVAGVARKKVKLDLPRAQSPTLAPPRPKKKSERASWLPTEDDGPIRMSSRKQTIANKDATLAKLKEKDRRRDDTLAMMKAAEARKLKAKEKPPTQAERLAEAARNERINKKTLHRWEEAEETRAAERQAKIDALKNRLIEGPYFRYYSGPGIWVDDKLKFTGKDAPSLDDLEEKVNKEFVAGQATTAQVKPVVEQSDVHTRQPHDSHVDDTQTSQTPLDHYQTSMTSTHVPSIPATLPPQQQTSHMPWTAASQGGDVFMGSHGMSYSNSVMFAPRSQDSFLYGIDQYAQNQQSQSTPTELPPNPFTQASPFQQQYTTSNSAFPQPHPPLNDPVPIQNGGSNIGPQALLSQLQKPPAPSAPPPPLRRKVIQRAVRNLLILSNFPHLDAPPSSSRAKTTASLIKDKDKSALIQLCATLFNWSTADATNFIHQTLIAPPKPPRKNAVTHKPETEIMLKPGQKICPITNKVARYRDPETGIAYHDVRAFGVLRGVVGGGFSWSGDLGCYVGGRAKPLESMGGKGFLGMPPAKNVPRRFWEMTSPRKERERVMAPPPMTTELRMTTGELQMHGPVNAAGPVQAIEGPPVVSAVAMPVSRQAGPATVKM
ncbi:YL1-domain-containing protein [Clathrospora elynae]|uniref:YL1-domain-containing protein n=1 Tax=Clathrospora elynae TaxID=706981 RepID=A0A6A5SY68_9PLEO|nr:YL1-domain-containing protein [Clathrospora elynae]